MITIQVSRLANPSFWQSYKKVMSFTDISVADKMNLVRLGKYMEEELQVARDSAAGLENASDIMAHELEFNVSFEMTVDSMADKLSATDIMNLEPLLSKEDV